MRIDVTNNKSPKTSNRKLNAARSADAASIVGRCHGKIGDLREPYAAAITDSGARALAHRLGVAPGDGRARQVDCRGIMMSSRTGKSIGQILTGASNPVIARGRRMYSCAIERHYCLSVCGHKSARARIETMLFAL